MPWIEFLSWGLPGSALPAFVVHVLLRQPRADFLHELQDRAQLDEAAEDHSDLLSLFFVYLKPAVLDVITNRLFAADSGPAAAGRPSGC